jgi:hypothetical protein
VLTLRLVLKGLLKGLLQELQAAVTIEQHGIYIDFGKAPRFHRTSALVTLQ